MPPKGGILSLLLGDFIQVAHRKSRYHKVMQQQVPFDFVTFDVFGIHKHFEQMN